MKRNDFFEIRLGFIYMVNDKGWDVAMKQYRDEFCIEEKTAKKWWQWYEDEICIAEVCYETDAGPEILTGEKGKGEKLEKLPFIVKGPLKVEFKNNIYNINREGLYRFTTITKGVRNLIMIENKNSLMPILKALSKIQVHGNRDICYSLEERKNLVLSRYWISLTCGDISVLAKEILKDAGFTSRLLSALTTDDWNTYNNGHMLLEVFFPLIKRWVLVDIDMGYVFLQDDVLIDAMTFWKCVKHNRRPVFIRLSEKEIDPLWLEKNGFSYAYMWRNIVKDENSKWNWYRRIFQSFGFQDENDKFIYLAEGRDARRVLEYRGHYATVMSEKNFAKKFYRS
ncbi:MAG: hypothetical protein N2115_03080 [bacterium]|nr:hypothetical protein [bacterium]